MDGSEWWRPSQRVGSGRSNGHALISLSLSRARARLRAVCEKVRVCVWLCFQRLKERERERKSHHLFVRLLFVQSTWVAKFSVLSHFFVPAWRFVRRHFSFCFDWLELKLKLWRKPCHGNNELNYLINSTQRSKRSTSGCASKELILILTSPQKNCFGILPTAVTEQDSNPDLCSLCKVVSPPSRSWCRRTSGEFRRRVVVDRNVTKLSSAKDPPLLPRSRRSHRIKRKPSSGKARRFYLCAPKSRRGRGGCFPDRNPQPNMQQRQQQRQRR